MCGSLCVSGGRWERGCLCALETGPHCSGAAMYTSYIPMHQDMRASFPRNIYLHPSDQFGNYGKPSPSVFLSDCSRPSAAEGHSCWSLGSDIPDFTELQTSLKSSSHGGLVCSRSALLRDLRGFYLSLRCILHPPLSSLTHAAWTSMICIITVG